MLLAPLLVIAWLLALLWLALITRLLKRLSRDQPALYAQLGQPVMRWLWWSWPDQRQGLAPRLALSDLPRGRVSLQTVHAPQEVGALARLLLLIVLKPRRVQSLDPACRRLINLLRLCAVGFCGALAGVMLVVIRQAS